MRYNCSRVSSGDTHSYNTVYVLSSESNTLVHWIHICMLPVFAPSYLLVIMAARVLVVIAYICHFLFAGDHSCQGAGGDSLYISFVLFCMCCVYVCCLLCVVCTLHVSVSEGVV